MKKIVHNLFSISTLLGLYIFTPQIKFASFLEDFPDIGILTGATLAIATFILGIVRKFRHTLPAISNTPLLPLILLMVYIKYSTGWAFDSVDNYALSKSYTFIFLTIPAVACAYYFCSTHKEQISNLQNILILGAIATTLEAYYLYFDPSIRNLNYLWGVNYLVTGQTLGMGLIFLFFKGWQVRQNPPTHCLYMIPFALMFFIFLQTGARGPVLFVVTTLIVMAFWLLKDAVPSSITRHYSIYMGGAGITFALLSLIPAHHQDSFIDRSKEILDTTNMCIQDPCITGRFAYIQKAWEGFLAHPFLGNGIGGMGYYEDSGTNEHYLFPHNMVLEVLSEIGLVGFSLMTIFVSFVIAGLWRTYKNDDSQTSPALVALFLFTSGNAMKSGDLNDNLVWFIACALITGFAQTLKKKTALSKH